MLDLRSCNCTYAELNDLMFLLRVLALQFSIPVFPIDDLVLDADNFLEFI